MVSAANSLGIPTLIHEQNVFPGNAIKMLAKKSTVTAISFSESTRYIENANEILLTGNPLRPEIVNADRASARAELGLGDDKYIVVFGGSLGASAINNTVCDYIEKYGVPSGIRMCFATGRYGFEDVSSRITPDKFPQVEVKQYIHNMDTVLSSADLVVCRSGAITVSEICALGVPAILVPSPNVTRNHQEYNARALSDKGAAITILEKDFDAVSLKTAADNIINDNSLSDGIRIKALAMAKTNAAEIIYDKLCKIIKK
jgi:UDP-N-acetylglucosamine--N-acetylmuramyl-(pentapeptide) pyrophosphoryl-undecaprenol N-acetylglucosamine transferase